LENIYVTRKILQLLGKPESLIKFVKDRPAHDRRYALSSNKIKKLGWKSRTPFDAGLEETVRWYENNDWWWRPLKKGAFAAYYERQYGGR